MNDNQNNPFEDSAFTTILVVSDMDKSKSFNIDVLGAKVFREYGGDSLVLEFLGNWLLLVSPGGGYFGNADPRFGDIDPSCSKWFKEQIA